MHAAMLLQLCLRSRRYKPGALAASGLVLDGCPSWRKHRPYRSAFFPTDELYSGCLLKKFAASGQMTSTRRLFCFAYSNAVWASSEATPWPLMPGGTSVCQIVIQPWLSVSNSRYATSPRSSISNRLFVTLLPSVFIVRRRQLSLPDRNGCDFAFAVAVLLSRDGITARAISDAPNAIRSTFSRSCGL
jgi:hypothetical protein